MRSVEIDSSKNYSYWLNTTGSIDANQDFLELALTNIGLLTVLDIRSRVFSQGYVTVRDEDGNELRDDDFLKLIQNPNYFQSQQDFLYQHLFYKSLGNNYSRVISPVGFDPLNTLDSTAIYNLIPSNLDLENIQNLNTFIVTSDQKTAFDNMTVTYTMGGYQTKVRIGDIVPFYDISNGLTESSWMQSPSRIPGIISALANIEELQLSKNINLIFSRKWLATNEGTDMNVRTPLTDGEKRDIEKRLFAKDIIASNAKVSAQSLSNDFRKLMLDPGFSTEMLKVSQMYGISKDVLNYFMEGSTYENQEKAVVRWIQDDIIQEGLDWGNTWTNHFGYQEEGKRISIEYDKLPVMQVIEKERREANETKADTFSTLIDAGVSPESAKIMAGYSEDFEIIMTDDGTNK